MCTSMNANTQSHFWYLKYTNMNKLYTCNLLKTLFWNLEQGRNQLMAEGAGPPSKMWLFIVIARRKCEKRVFSLAQYYHNTSKVSWIIINTINIYIKLKLQKLVYN